MIAIHLYSPDDYDACRGLWVELTEHHRRIYGAPTIGGDDPGSGFDGYLRDERLAATWVAVEHGAVVGMAGLLVDGSEAEIEPVVVTAAQRRRGIGRMLIDRAVAEARGRGVSMVNIRPVARNVSAVHAFHKAGFRTAGHVELFMDLRPEGRSWESGFELHGERFEY